MQKGNSEGGEQMKQDLREMIGDLLILNSLPPPFPELMYIFWMKPMLTIF